MNDATKPVDDPLGPQDPLTPLLRRAYTMFPPLGAHDPHAASTALWGRLGWTDPDTHLVEPHFLALVRHEVASALDLLGHPLVLDPRKVSDWVYGRVRDEAASLSARQLLRVVAEVVRDTRCPERPGAGGPTREALSTWQGLADGGSIADWIGRLGPAADTVAATSRGLAQDGDDPDLAEVFVLAAYAGRSDAELAGLLETTPDVARAKRLLADEIVQADVRRVLGKKGGTVVAAPAPHAATAASVPPEGT